MDIREFVDDYVNKVVDDTIAEINEGMVEYLKAEGYNVTKEEEEEPRFKLPTVPYEIGFVDEEGNYERVGSNYPTKEELDRGFGYSHIAYADDEVGTGFTSEHSTDKAFIGFYCDSKPEDSQRPEDYLWLPIKEEYVKKEPTKVEPTTGYSHIAYADDEEGTGFTTQKGLGKKFLGIYLDDKEEDSESPKDYDWLPIAEDAVDESEPTILFAYADSPDGSENFSREMGGRKYIGVIDFNSPTLIDNEIAPDPNDPQFYEWSRFM